MRRDDADVLREWRDRAMAHQNAIPGEVNLWRYFQMVRTHATTGVNDYKALLFFALPLALRARRIVELGSSFSFYPDTYEDGSPWGVSSDRDEGVVSTRIILSACRLLKQLGVPSKLLSIELRDASYIERWGNRDLVARARQLIDDLGLSEFWELHTGTDTVAWLAEERGRLLRGETEPIDFVLVDSNHTYDQVSRELAGVLPVLSATGAILVDDCFETNYAHGVDWIPEDSAEGLRRGGEYGAVLEFLDAHPDWHGEWMQSNVLLTRQQPAV